MTPRLIPWCLAATGFLAALAVFTWPRKQSGAAQGVQLYVAAVQRLPSPAVEHPQFRPSQTPVAPEVSEDAPHTLTLPLPSATQPDLDPSVQPVPDDEPTVEDLPTRRTEPELPE